MRRIVVAVVGGTLVIVGLFLLVFPGPGVLTIAAGLALLATEFTWASKGLSKMRRKISEVGRNQRFRDKRQD